MGTSIGADGIVSDDFASGTLGGHWTEVDVNSGGAVTFEGSAPDQWAVLTVDSGASHDTDTSAMEAYQLVQTPTAGNVDFELEVKFETIQDTTTYRSYGLVAHSTAPTYVQFVAFNNGTNLELHLDYDGTTRSSFEFSGSPSAPFWMKLVRTVNTWSGEYSETGVEPFTEMPQDYTAAALTVDQVGFMAGNCCGGTAPQHICKVDYFFENSARIDPEDPTGGTRRVMVIS